MNTSQRFRRALFLAWRVNLYPGLPVPLRILRAMGAR